MKIFQDGAGNMADVAHVVSRGIYTPSQGSTLVIGDEEVVYGPAVSATWIGAQMSGGGPGIDTLAPY